MLGALFTSVFGCTKGFYLNVLKLIKLLDISKTHFPMDVINHLNLFLCISTRKGYNFTPYY
jgi:hypothetical protein